MNRAAPVTQERVTDLTRVLSAMRFVTSFTFGCAGTVRILHMDVLELDLRAIGAIMAAYSVLSAVVEVPSGAISDVWGRRKTKLLASWVMVGAYVVFAAADGLLHVIVASALLGIGRALFSGAADAWFVDEVGDAKDPRVLGGIARSEAAHNLGFGLGALCGALLPQLYAAEVDDRFIFSPIFLLGAFMLLVDIWLTIRWMIETRAPVSYPEGGVWSTALAGVGNSVDAPRPRWAALSMVVLGGAVACNSLLAPLSISENIGADRGLIVFGPLVAASWLLSAAGSLATERLKNAIGSVTRTNSVLMLAIGVLILPVGLGFGSWWAAAISYTGVNLVLGALVPLLMTTLHEHVRSSNRSAASSTLQLSMMAGATVLSLVVGAVGGVAVITVFVGAVVAAGAFAAIGAKGEEVEASA